MNLLSYIFRAVQIAPYQGVGVLTPPTVAPVLTVEADLGSYIANLSWTASNKTGSPGFGYNIYRQVANASWELIDTVGAATLSYSDDLESSSPNVFRFYITPKNNAGEGPSSNTAVINLPGESEAPVLTGPGTADTNQQFTLNWNDIPGADSYEVDRSDDGGASWGLLDTVLVSTLDVTETAADTYKYRVTPFAGAFEGLVSNVLTVVVTTPAAPATYRRPGGIDTYLRPDGISLYLRP